MHNQTHTSTHKSHKSHKSHKRTQITHQSHKQTNTHHNYYTRHHHIPMWVPLTRHHVCHVCVFVCCLAHSSQRTWLSSFCARGNVHNSTKKGKLLVQWEKLKVIFWEWNWNLTWNGMLFRNPKTGKRSSKKPPKKSIAISKFTAKRNSHTNNTPTHTTLARAHTHNVITIVRVQSVCWQHPLWCNRRTTHRNILPGRPCRFV